MKKIESLIKKLETSSVKMRFLNTFCDNFSQRYSHSIPYTTKSQTILFEYNNLATHCTEASLFFHVAN